MVLAAPENGVENRPRKGRRAACEHVYVPEYFDSEKLPVTLAPKIQRFLRVANQIGRDEPHVAHFCRVHAFAVAHNLDRHSIGSGVRQFKTSLLQRLQQDEEVMKGGKNDLLSESRRVYRQYNDYIIKHGEECKLENREKLIEAREIESVLLEVLNAASTAVTSQAKSVVQNMRSSPFVENSRKQVPLMDLFDHLILILANSPVRRKHKKAPKLIDGAVDVSMKKSFKKYSQWCEFLSRKSSIH